MEPIMQRKTGVLSVFLPYICAAACLRSFHSFFGGCRCKKADRENGLLLRYCSHGKGFPLRTLWRM